MIKLYIFIKENKDMLPLKHPLSSTLWINAQKNRICLVPWTFNCSDYYDCSAILICYHYH
jgi:hypothetical protein